MASRRSRWSAPPAARNTRYDKDGKPFLTKEPKLLLNDNNAGKPEGIHLMIGRRPVAAFGNSTGDRRCSNTPRRGGGARLAMLVLHDDATREYAYGPAQGLPDTKVGTFTQALYDEAKKDGWIVISMKNDWKRIFAFDMKSARAEEITMKAKKLAGRFTAAMATLAPRDIRDGPGAATASRTSSSSSATTSATGTSAPTTAA